MPASVFGKKEEDFNHLIHPEWNNEFLSSHNVKRTFLAAPPPEKFNKGNA